MRASGMASVVITSLAGLSLVNVFNRVLCNPNLDRNNVAFAAISTAQPPRQFQFGVRFDS